MYWIPSTCFSMTFALVMKIQGVRDALGYPKLVDHTPSEEYSQTWKQSESVCVCVCDHTPTLVGHAPNHQPRKCLIWEY